MIADANKQRRGKQSKIYGTEILQMQYAEMKKAK